MGVTGRIYERPNRSNAWEGLELGLGGIVVAAQSVDCASVARFGDKWGVKISEGGSVFVRRVVFFLNLPLEQNARRFQFFSRFLVFAAAQIKTAGHDSGGASTKR